MISAWWHMVGVVVIVAILIIVPDNHQSLSYVFTQTDQQLGLRRRDDRSSSLAFLLVLGLGHAAPAVHDHGLRRVGAHGRGDAQRVAHGRDGDVDVGRGLGDLRLDPARGVTFAIRAPGRARDGQQPSAFSSPGSGRSR